jgi:hypothetical protein
MEPPDGAFDISYVTWEHGKFKPWHIPKPPSPLRSLSLDEGEELLVGEVGGRPVGFLLREVTYHHVVQGVVGGTLHDHLLRQGAGVVTSPVINGREHRFREVGVYNGGNDPPRGSTRRSLHLSSSG